ncbi:MAG: hypothetical protein C0456_18005 [Hyphomonas sp.]|nr:hypothetical protein [Hyphomonas sp.]
MKFLEIAVLLQVQREICWIGFVFAERGPTLSLPIVMGRGPVAFWGEGRFRRRVTCPLPMTMGRVGVGWLSA